MWAQGLRPLRSRLHRTVRFSRLRNYNGQLNAANQGSLPVYFQQPPRPPKRGGRILRSVLLGTTCFVAGVYVTFSAFHLDELESGAIPGGDEEARAMHDALSAGAEDAAARHVPVMDLERAQEMLSIRGGYSVTPTAVGHYSQLPSNLPCEDSMDSGIYNLFGDQKRDWANWSIFDGHAGPRTATLLREMLAVIVGHELWQDGCMDRSYAPNDYTIVRTIKKAFRTVDHDMLQDASNRVLGGEGDLAHTIAMLAPAMSGSCALLALFDPARQVLRVANTGDSRAVLGRWDESKQAYVAIAMSEDQTGFNPNEIERMKREHPDEDVIDPKTGRVHGIAVSRAFGDARWKWSQEMTRTVYEKFWGPAPRPEGLIKTPPYLTAEPEIMDTQIQGGEHPDFLIMATDGLWDHISSEDAVTCVQQWLDRYRPTNFLDRKSPSSILMESFRGRGGKQEAQQFNPQAYKPDFKSDPGQDEETYWDENEGALKWAVNPKHFIVEDENCGVHLIKNVLGGSRRNLFRGVMSIQPPLSRKVRDDITVQVIFFGVDASHGMRTVS